MANGSRTRSPKSVAKSVDTVGRGLRLLPEERRYKGAPSHEVTKTALDHKARPWRARFGG